MWLVRGTQELPSQCSKSNLWDNTALCRPGPDIGFWNANIYMFFFSECLSDRPLISYGPWQTHTPHRGLPGQRVGCIGLLEAGSGKFVLFWSSGNLNQPSLIASSVTSLTSLQETPPGSSQPGCREGRGLRCPADPTSAPGGFCTEDSPSVTPSALGCLFLPRTSGRTRAGSLSKDCGGRPRPAQTAGLTLDLTTRHHRQSLDPRLALRADAAYLIKATRMAEHRPS